MHQQPLDIREVEKHDFYLATRVFADGHEEKRRTDDERREILWTSSFALLPTDSIEATTKQEKRSESADSKSKEGKGIGRLSVQFLPEARLRFLGKERRHDARSAAQDGRLSPRAEPDDHGHMLDMLERRAARLLPVRGVFADIRGGEARRHHRRPTLRSSLQPQPRPLPNKKRSESTDSKNRPDKSVQECAMQSLSWHVCTIARGRSGGLSIAVQPRTAGYRQQQGRTSITLDKSVSTDGTKERFFPTRNRISRLH